MVESLEGSAAGTGSVAVGHDVDGDGSGFLPIGGKGAANLGEEPLLEVGSGFDGATADDEGVGVEGGDHLIEEERQSMCLRGKELAGEGIAFFGEATDEAGGFAEVAKFGKVVVGVMRQESREEIFFERG